ncbi:hypothetical protein [Nocardia gipuzkoensis]|uniref:hypothetical protein n=1 Tax=Nocardia gipuzkoensis TaxID=2749991 RepID=UPI00237E1CD7|nr:hypothetical protein [Nocardia gipuzkoensis]MDE1674351.1 hypothetical protein [Nocardia gipuzkoensis]
MARPAKLPPTKKVGIDLSREVVAAIADEAAARGINIRALYEVALRRELGLPDYPGLPPAYKEDLRLPA